MKRTRRHYLTLALSLMLVLLTWTAQTALAAESPTFNAEITNTHRITLTFNKDMQDPAGLGGGGFSYTINGADQTVTSITYNAGNPSVYALELHAGIQPGDTVTLSYTPGATPIQSTEGGLLASFSNLALTNNLDTTAPTIFVATTQDDNNNTNNDGTYLSVSFSLQMADPPAAPDGFTVTVNGSPVTITDIYRKPLFNSVYMLRLQTAIQYGQEVRLSYTPGTVQSYYGVDMAADANHYVNNQLPQPVSADLTNIALSGNPSDFTFSASTYTYENVTVENNVSGITVTPTGSGTITVDDTIVASGNASGEIALTAGVEQTILVKTTEAGKAVKTYTIKVTRLGFQAAPTFIPAQGAVAFDTELQIISANADHIYYTTDGSMPGTSVGGSTLEYNDFARPVINQSMTVRAIAVKSGWGNSECSSAVYTQALSENLTGLLLSGSPANFAFSGDTYAYNNVTVANSVTGITVTPTGAGMITVNGTIVASGAASAEIPLTAGTEETITVTATENEKSPRTYSIHITRAQSGGGSSSPAYILRTLTDNATGVSVSGRINRRAALTVRDIALHPAGTCAACDAIRARMDDLDDILLFSGDISLSKGFTGQLTVAIPVGGAYNGATATLLHCKNGRLETLTATVENGEAVFTVGSLSPFAVFAAPQVLPDIPKTGGRGLPIGVVLLTLCALAVVSVSHRKQRE